MVTDYRVVVSRAVKPNTGAAWLARAKAAGAAAASNAAELLAIAPLVQQLATDTAALDVAQAAAADGGRVDTTTRNARLRDLKKSYRAYVSGVQGLCDGAPDQAHAEEIAAWAGLSVTQKPVHGKPDFYGKAIGGGAVRLYARAPAKRVRYYAEWQMSTDGGKTFLALPNTNESSTVVPNLTPLTSVSFRHRTMVKNVVSEWSQTIAVVVL
jgi:hypothetical protein